MAKKSWPGFGKAFASSFEDTTAKLPIGLRASQSNVRDGATSSLQNLTSLSAHFSRFLGPTSKADDLETCKEGETISKSKVF